MASIRGKKTHVYRVIILKQMADHIHIIMQIKFVPVVYQAQIFLFPWVSRHDCIDSNLQGIYIDMQVYFVRVGYCATNILRLDSLKQVKLNY